MDMIKNMVVFLRYPSEGMYRLKKRTRVWEGVVLYLCAFAVRMAALYLTHAPLRATKPSDTTLFMEGAILLGPLLSWVLVSYGLSSIRNGESKLSLVFVSTGYCLLPYILFTVPIALLSHVMAASEADIYAILQGALYIWMAFLFYKQVMEGNNYRFRDTIELILLSLFGIVILWATLLLLYTFVLSAWTFVEELFLDVRTLTDI